eukprot:scaffold38406_cov58-Phaeocystis_antarctica.AAC.4
MSVDVLYAQSGDNDQRSLGPLLLDRSTGLPGSSAVVVRVRERVRECAHVCMARIKEGLGSEAPTAPSCTSGLAAAAPSTICSGYRGGI